MNPVATLNPTVVPVETEQDTAEDGLPELVPAPSAFVAPHVDVEPGQAAGQYRAVPAPGIIDWTSSITASNQVAAGKPITLTALFTNRVPGVVVATFEVYDPAGRKVYQALSSNMYVAAGEHRFSRSWLVPYGTSPGKYTVSFGVSSRDLKSVLHWVNPASIFDVFVNGQ